MTIDLYMLAREALVRLVLAIMERLSHYRRREILVVDDFSPLLRWIARNTREFEVHTASKSEEAWAIVAKHDLHAAIIDVFLARSNGLDLVRPLRLLRPHLRIATVSGWPDPAIRKASFDAGADCFLAKPYTVDSILALLGNAPPRCDGESPCINLGRSRALADWEYVHAVLKAAGGNRSEAARRLNISRRALQLFLKKRRPPR